MKKNIIGYTILTCIIIALLIICIVLSNKENSTEKLPPYELTEADVQEYDISKFTEYELLKRELYSYDEFDAEVAFNEDTMYAQYELSECSLMLGQVVKQGDSLGKSNMAENVLCAESGRVIELLKTDDDMYILTVLRASCFHVSIRLPLENFNSVDYSTVMQGILVNGNTIDLKVSKIIYEVSDGKIPIELAPVNDCFDIFPGTSISVRYNFKKSDCEYFINYNAFLIDGKYSYIENTYYEFIVRKYNQETSKYVYSKEFIKTGEKIGNYVGLYFYDPDCTLLVKR